MRRARTGPATTVKVYELEDGMVEFVMPGGKSYLGSRVQAIQALTMFLNHDMTKDRVGYPETVAMLDKLEALEVTA